jgi:hypothetical protein
MKNGSVTDGNKSPGSTISNGNTTQALLDDLEARGYKLSVNERGNLSTEPDGPPMTPVIWHALQANYAKLVRLLRPSEAHVTNSSCEPNPHVRKDNTDWSRVADLMPARGEEFDKALHEYRHAYQAASEAVKASESEGFAEGFMLHCREMDKLRSGRDHEAKRRIEASKKGGACGGCGRALKDGETVYARCRVYAGMAGGLMSRPGPRFEAVSVCEGCAPKYMSAPLSSSFETQIDAKGSTVRTYYGAGVAEMPCATCQRPVRHKRTARWQPRVYCCYRCEYTYHNRRRSQRDEHLRQKTCEVCSEEFTATRAHAKTCSPACKQKGYRQRKESGRDVIG